MKHERILQACLCCALGFLVLKSNVLHAAPASNIPTQKSQSAGTPSDHDERAANGSELIGRVATEMPQSLLRAYQREFVVLETEKRILQQRLEKMRMENDARIQRARDEHAKIETELMAISLLADQKERQLERREIEGEQSSQVGEIIQTIEAQSAEIGKKGIIVEISSVAGEEENAPHIDENATTSSTPKISHALERALGRAMAKLQSSESVYMVAAPFFDVDGKKTEATILRIGEVAAFGVTNAGAQALSPAGGNALKVWPTSRMQNLNAENVFESAAPLQIFLSDNWSQAIEQKKEKTPLQIVQSGGTIAWVIVGLGVIALFLSLLRTANLYWVGRGIAKEGDAVGHAIREKDFPLAEQICDNTRAISELLRVVLHSKDMPRDVQHDLMDEQILRIFARIDRFGQMILVAAAVAPLLGLLGTVTGMISTFDAITEFGTGDPRVLAGGISEALITTELGLIVAIPSLLIGNLLSGQAERLKNVFESTGLQAANLCREIDEKTKPQILHGEPAWTRVS